MKVSNPSSCLTRRSSSFILFSISHLFVASLQGAYCHRLFLGGRFVPRDSDPFSHHDKFEGQSLTRIELPFPHFCSCCSYIFPLGLPSSAVGSKSNEPHAASIIAGIIGSRPRFCAILKDGDPDKERPSVLIGSHGHDKERRPLASRAARASIPALRPPSPGGRHLCGPARSESESSRPMAARRDTVTGDRSLRSAPRRAGRARREVRTCLRAAPGRRCRLADRAARAQRPREFASLLRARPDALAAAAEARARPRRAGALRLAAARRPAVRRGGGGL